MPDQYGNITFQDGLQFAQTLGALQDQEWSRKDRAQQELDRTSYEGAAKVLGDQNLDPEKAQIKLQEYVKSNPGISYIGVMKAMADRSNLESANENLASARYTRKVNEGKEKFNEMKRIVGVATTMGLTENSAQLLGDAIRMYPAGYRDYKVKGIDPNASTVTFSYKTFDGQEKTETRPWKDMMSTALAATDEKNMDAFLKDHLTQSELIRQTNADAVGKAETFYNSGGGVQYRRAKFLDHNAEPITLWFSTDGGKVVAGEGNLDALDPSLKDMIKTKDLPKVPRGTVYTWNERAELMKISETHNDNVDKRLAERDYRTAQIAEEVRKNAAAGATAAVNAITKDADMQGKTKEDLYSDLYSKYYNEGMKNVNKYMGAPSGKEGGGGKGITANDFTPDKIAEIQSWKPEERKKFLDDLSNEPKEIQAAYLKGTKLYVSSMGSSVVGGEGKGADTTWDEVGTQKTPPVQSKGTSITEMNRKTNIPAKKKVVKKLSASDKKKAIAAEIKKMKDERWGELGRQETVPEGYIRTKKEIGQFAANVRNSITDAVAALSENEEDDVIQRAYELSKNDDSLDPQDAVALAIKEIKAEKAKRTRRPVQLAM